MFVTANNGNRDKSLGKFQRCGNRLFEARSHTLLHEQPIDHDFNRVIFPLVERWWFIEGIQFSVDSDANKSVLRQFLEFLTVGTFAAADDRCQDHDAVVGLAEFAVQDCLYDLFARLPGDRLAAIGQCGIPIEL